ncbi:PhoU domain-containing protein [Desulfosporosinus burensis]
MALANASRETLRMGRMAGEAYENSKDYFFDHNPHNKHLTVQFEAAIDNLENEITDYVLKITSGKMLTSEQSNLSYRILQVIGDIERVGDHATNLMELTDYAIESKVNFSEQANSDLMNMFEKVQEIFTMSLEALNLTDGFETINSLYSHASDCHVDYVLPGVLYLRGKTRGVFLDFIKQEFPHLYKPLQDLYKTGGAGKDYKDKLYVIVNELKDKYKLSSS